MKQNCPRCGGKSVFTLLFADPEKRGGKEKSDSPVPLVWECRGCQLIRPLVLTGRGAQ